MPIAGGHVVAWLPVPLIEVPGRILQWSTYSQLQATVQATITTIDQIRQIAGTKVQPIQLHMRDQAELSAFGTSATSAASSSSTIGTSATAATTTTTAVSIISPDQPDRRGWTSADYAAEAGYTVKKVNPAGDCIFEAVVDFASRNKDASGELLITRTGLPVALTRTPAMAQAVRELRRVFVQHCRDTFSVNQEFALSIGEEDYTAMEQSGQWGQGDGVSPGLETLADHVTHLLSRYFDCPIVVFDGAAANRTGGYACHWDGGYQLSMEPSKQIPIYYAADMPPIIPVKSEFHYDTVQQVR